MSPPDAKSSTERALDVFLRIGLAENVAKDTLVNPKLCKALLDLVEDAGATHTGLSKAKGNLLYHVLGKYPANALVHRPALLALILDESIKSIRQLHGAFEYLKKVGGTPLDTHTLREAAGVGAVISREEIAAAVAAVVVKEETHPNINVLLGQVMRVLKWADAAAVRAELERQIGVLDKQDKQDKQHNISDATAAKSILPGAATDLPSDPYAFLPKPDENNMVHTTVTFSDGRVMRISNTPCALKKHLEITGGKVVTRFPPEPNGYLHIGHAKAMFVDFGMAAQYGGVCYLRYDDTNPVAEKSEYIEHIHDIVKWMGWTPWKITHTSDYFQELFDFAVQLIESGHAYVCHQTKDEIDKFREAREPSPWRDRPAEESLKWFEDMRRGLVDEGRATLRLKMDHKNENYNMFDLVAYRIKFREHPHAGDEWCVYPSYDFAHCIVDSLENITHSLCTLEFESRRASYFWLLEVLGGMYKPVVWEYSRLNITNTVMSKRKLNLLVTGGHVNGWDDPRLMTLAGLRRRGVTPRAINSFCREIGITRNENLIPMHRLEHHVRSDLDTSSPRVLAVLRPLKLVVVNLPSQHFEEVDAKCFPGRSDEGYKVPFTRVVYIESTDFREQDDKHYYGLAPGKSVMLRYAYTVTYKSHRMESGRVVEVEVEADLTPAENKKPPKGVLNWVAQPAPGQEPFMFEARMFDHLFRSDDPSAGVDGNWLDDINTDSLRVIKGCMGVPALASAKPFDRFQFERLGYFCADPDSEPGRAVFNRTVTLREAAFPKQARSVCSALAPENCTSLFV